MSDHYCCKRCTRRYDDCVCPPATSKMPEVPDRPNANWKSLKAKSPAVADLWQFGDKKPAVKKPLAFEVDSVTDEDRLNHVVLVIGYGNVGKATVKHMVDRAKAGVLHSKPNLSLFIADKQKPVLRKRIDGVVDQLGVTEAELDKGEHFKTANVVVLCIDSYGINSWIIRYGNLIRDKTLIVRSTLPISFKPEMLPRNFAYVPEFSTEHAMATKQTFKTEGYYASSPHVESVVRDLFQVTHSSTPFKEVAARKLLHNAAVATNAVFHNTALELMRDHGIAPERIDTYEMLDVPSKNRSFSQHSLKFAGKCLRPALEMLYKERQNGKYHEDFWFKIDRSNEEVFNRYMNALIVHITRAAGGTHTVRFDLVLAGLNYNASEPSSTYRNSTAMSIVQWLHMRTPIKTWLHPLTTKAHLAEVASMPNPPTMFSQASSVANGLFLIQTVPSVVRTIAAVVPIRRRTENSRARLKPFYVYDPLMQVTERDVQALQKKTDVPIKVITKLE